MTKSRTDAKIKCRILAIGIVMLLVAAGCRPGSPEDTQELDAQFRGQYPIKAVVTVGMVADLVREVGGPHVQVEQIMGSGVDPHLYKPTRDDVARIMNADMVYFVGLVLEGRMAETLKRATRSRPAVAVGERIDPKLLIHPTDASGHSDPHIWMDVAIWMQCLEVVAESLAKFDPAHADDYQANVESYRTHLSKLDAYGKEAIGSIPPDHRVLVTSHDAFHYFGRAYGLEVRGVQGISTESEAGLRQVNDLVDLIVRRGVSAVFVESSVPRKSIEAVVEGVRSRGGEVSIGGLLFSDAMGTAGTYEGTYVGMLDHNITTVTRRTGGERPATWVKRQIGGPWRRSMNSGPPAGVEQHGPAASGSSGGPTTGMRPVKTEAPAGAAPLGVPLSVYDLTVAYHRRPVLWDVTVDIPHGQLVGVVGPNGAGKSTFFKAVMDLVPRVSGRVLVFGELYRRNRHRVGYVPQRESVDWDFPVDAIDVVAMGLYGQIGWFRWVTRQHRQRAMLALDRVGMADFARRQISQLSGGQQQRTFLARALVQDADLYLMDEPFAGVDAATEQAVLQLLRDLKNRGKTVVVIHHDLQSVEEYFDYLILLNMRIVAHGPVSEVFHPENLHKTYGGRLTLLEEAAEAMRRKDRSP